MRIHIVVACALWFLPADAYYWDEIATQVQWRRLQFAYRSEADRQNDIRSGNYDPDTPAPIDVDVYYQHGERILFVTIPKFGPGVPVTFGTVGTQIYQGDPVIEPFPSWEWHRNTERCSPNRLVSVFRVQIDRCGLLWILDSGNAGDGVICPPQLVIFDLKRWPQVQTPYHRYEFPAAVYNQSSSIFLTPIIESRGYDCKQRSFAYVADTTGQSIVVTDMADSYSWRIQDVSMQPEAAFTDFTIAGVSFSVDDGVMGMSLTPEKGVFDDDRYLYYSVLAGSRMARISTRDLKNARYNRAPTIRRYHTPRRSQSAPMAINRDGIAFFGLISNITINCWNVNSDDYGRYIGLVYDNPITMQFPSGVKIVNGPDGREELWVLTNRLQKLMTNGYDFNEVNFRISKGYVDELLHYSRCTMPNY